MGSKTKNTIAFLQKKYLGVNLIKHTHTHIYIYTHTHMLKMIPNTDFLKIKEDLKQWRDTYSWIGRLNIVKI